MAFMRTTRRTDEDLDGLFSCLTLDFFFLTQSEEDNEVDDEEEEGPP